MKGGVQLELCQQPLDRLEADVAVAGFFSDDRPLRGGAGRLDWRLCGQLSELLATGRFEGDLGSAVLLPGSGPIAASRVLVLGLGHRREFSVRRCQEVMREAMRRCLDLGSRRVAMAPLGIALDDLGRHAQPLVSGLSQAVRSAEPVSDERPNGVVVRLALSAQQWRDAAEVLPAILAQQAEPPIVLLGESGSGERPSTKSDDSHGAQSAHLNLS